jgi:hypothetical protein
MKRFTFAALALSLTLLASAPAFASGVEFGLKAGVTSSNLTGAIADANKPTSATEFSGGVMLGLPLPGGILAIQGEALLVTKGADIPVVGGSDVYRFRDVEFPVLARLTLPGVMPIKPFIVAGPSFAYNIDATVDPADPAVPKQDLSDVRKLDTGFVAGLGARASLAGFGVTAEGRYTSSLQDVLKDNSAALPGKNAVYTFLVGVVF